MSEFLFLYRGRDEAATSEQMENTMRRWAAWMKELSEAGHVITLGHPLQNSGAVVRGQDRLVIDGPFAEAKDVIAGYTLIKAKDLAEANELAKGCPILDVGGTVEVRPVMEMPARA
ncbi:MAG: YciI family protein [Fimbriimonadaceae bacterium]